MTDLRQLARDKPCVLCGANDGSTVLHHIREGGDGGMGKKPPDWPWGVRVCHRCHDHLHGRDGSSEAVRLKNSLRAMGRQQIQYATEGIVQWR